MTCKKGEDLRQVVLDKATPFIVKRRFKLYNYYFLLFLALNYDVEYKKIMKRSRIKMYKRRKYATK
jgi:hypothetical protein